LSKFFYIFLFFCGTALFAQNTIAVADSTAIEKKAPLKGKKWKESDIAVDYNDSIAAAHFAPRFKEEYKSDEFIYEQKLKQKNAWERFLEWLEAFVSRLFGMGDGAAADLLGWVFRILAFAVIGFLIFLIVKAILNKEGKWIFGKNSDKKLIRYDDIEKNLHLVDFEKLIRETLQSGEKRLAIRYYYLWLLKVLSEKEIIEWDVEKTNSDYLYEIRNQKLKHNFGYLSHIYNYIWYGEFGIDEATFDKAKAIFEQTIKSV
jgi:hypothetical protein